MKIVFSLLLMFTETILFAASYDDRRDYNINTDRRFDYQTAYNYSGSDSFWINSRSEFLSNRDYAPLVSLARRDNGLNNFLTTRVAPNINITDYAGYKIAENLSWQNYSNLSRNYETQNYSQVIKEGGNYKSFEVASLRNGWKVKEKVENISYGANSLPNKLTLTTSDLAGNTFIQEISNIFYGRAADQSRLQDLTGFSLAKSKQEGMYGFDNLYLSLKDQAAPPHYLVSAFRLEAIDPAGKITNIDFSEITWSKNTIAGFKVSLSLEGRWPGEGDTIIQVNTSGDKIKAAITENKVTANYALNEDITTQEFMDKLKLGINPLEILGSNKIQLGDAKLVFLTKTYTDEGILDGGPKKFQIDYGITDKKNIENEIKTNLAKLEQTAPAIVRKIIADQPIKTLDKGSLTQLQETVVSAIQHELSRCQKTPEIKNDWQLTLAPADKLKLKFVDNQIVSETKLTANAEISEGIITNPTFAIENGELKAISGVYTKNTGEIQKLTSPKVEVINNLPQSIMVKDDTKFKQPNSVPPFFGPTIQTISRVVNIETVIGVANYTQKTISQAVNQIFNKAEKIKIEIKEWAEEKIISTGEAVKQVEDKIIGEVKEKATELTYNSAKTISQGIFKGMSSGIVGGIIGSLTVSQNPSLSLLIYPTLKQFSGWEYYSKEYALVKDDIGSDFKNFIINYTTDKSLSETYRAKDGNLTINLHDRYNSKLNQSYAIVGELFNKSPGEHKFILSNDNRPVAIIPSNTKPITEEMGKALTEAKINMLNTPEDFQKIVKQNTIVAASNGVGNPNTRETSPDMQKLVDDIKGEKGSKLPNTVAPPLYTRGPVFNLLAKIHTPEPVMFILQNIIRDSIILDGGEMISPFSVQRNIIIEKIRERTNNLKSNGKLGVAPFLLLIGFSGGADPSVEVGSYFGNKASIISLDGPTAKQNISGIFQYTRFVSSFVGELYAVDKFPQNMTMKYFTNPSNSKEMLNISKNHFIFFEDKKINQIVLDTVRENIENRFKVMLDELIYKRRD
ncbi:MAG: hypothetical protein ABII74_05735 [Elusimicrobiota bacterium]